MDKITEEDISKNISNLGEYISVPDSVSDFNKIRKRHNHHGVERKAFFITAACFLLIFFIGVLPVTSSTIKRLFYKYSADIGVLKSDSTSNNTTSIAKSVEDNDIKVTLNGVVCDGIRTVISARFESEKTSLDHIYLGGVKLIDSESTLYNLHEYGRGVSDNGQKYYNTSITFSGSPKKDTQLKLSISSINNVEGKWNFKFKAHPKKVSIYKANGIYNKKNIYLKIRKVTFTATSTILEGTINGSNMDFTSTLSNTNNEVGEQFSGERDKSGAFKLYFSPISKTDKLLLKINTVQKDSVILSMDINLEELKH